jgi:hypothetical protein
MVDMGTFANAAKSGPSRYWAKKADAAHARAREMTDEKAKELMIKVAKRYEAMASIVVRRVSPKEQ